MKDDYSTVNTIKLRCFGKKSQHPAFRHLVLVWLLINIDRKELWIYCLLLAGLLYYFFCGFIYHAEALWVYNSDGYAGFWESSCCEHTYWPGKSPSFSNLFSVSLDLWVFKNELENVRFQKRRITVTELFSNTI